MYYYDNSLCLIILEGEAALGVLELFTGLGCALDGAIRYDDPSPGAAVPYDPQRELTDALDDLVVALLEAEYAAVIVVQDHHRRQTWRRQHRRLRAVHKSVNRQKFFAR